MPTNTTTTPTTSTASPSCSTPGCKHKLAHNNSTGTCGACQARLGTRSHTKSQPAKRNGNGHDAVSGARIQERLKLFLAAVDLPLKEVFEVIPRADKEKLIQEAFEVIPHAEKEKLIQGWLLGKLA